MTVAAIAVQTSPTRASMAAMVELAAHDWGRIDILINNAAISDDTPIEELSDEHWRHVLAVNLDAALMSPRRRCPI